MTIPQDYIFALTLVAMARFMDMFSTWMASPDLKLELNPIVRKLGWNGWLIANICVCLVAAWTPEFTMALTFLSVAAAGRNFWVWYRHRA